MRLCAGGLGGPGAAHPGRFLASVPELRRGSTRGSWSWIARRGNRICRGERRQIPHRSRGRTTWPTSSTPRALRGSPRGSRSATWAPSTSSPPWPASRASTEGDVMVAVTTISFDIAVLELYLPLSVGARGRAGRPRGRGRRRAARGAHRRVGGHGHAGDAGDLAGPARSGLGAGPRGSRSSAAARPCRRTWRGELLAPGGIAVERLRPHGDDGLVGGPPGRSRGATAGGRCRSAGRSPTRPSTCSTGRSSRCRRGPRASSTSAARARPRLPAPPGPDGRAFRARPVLGPPVSPGRGSTGPATSPGSSPAACSTSWAAPTIR